MSNFSRPGRVSLVGSSRVSGAQSSRAPFLSALRQAWMKGLYTMECTGPVWISRVRTGSLLPVSGCMMWMFPESATLTATSEVGAFFLWTNSTAPGLNFSLIMQVMSKLQTSKSFRALSSPIVARSRPSFVSVMPTSAPRWARKCFTNSMPSACFFQNLMWPSTLPVIRKPVTRLEQMQQTVSRCIKLFSYISLWGRLSR
mmetsp:Transcript_2047/g.6006  ORF Transcript_2047/g.6006 Transcript_2047/m.6006 type:complete len:200 (+) Transcript_2047:978-1577(+)